MVNEESRKKKSSKPIMETTAKFLDYTAKTPTSTRTGKVGKPKRRYYIHLKDPDIVERDDFPIKPNEMMIVKVYENKLVLIKAKLMPVE